MSGARTLRDWLTDQPFTLAMSSGFFGFFAHGGMLAAMCDESIFPAELSGSSAGALTAGLWAAGLEPGEIRELFVSLRKKDFWDPGPGPGWLKGHRFRALIRDASPVSRLEACRRPMSVSVFDLSRMSTRVLTSGDLASALYASCAVPFMFRPLAHAGGLLVDGGLRDRPGLAGISPGRRVLCHHIPARASRASGAGSGPRIPRRYNMAALAVLDLPRPGPGALHAGPAAWSAAREATLRALDLPLRSGQVAIAAAVEDHERRRQI